MTSDFEARAAERRKRWQGASAASPSAMVEADLKFWEQASASVRLDAVWEMPWRPGASREEPNLHQDFKDLLSVFADEKVSYLLIGGYAVSFYDRPRYTKDLDLWISSEPANLKRVYSALAKFGAPPHVLRDLERLGPDEVLWMGNPPVRVDLLQNVDGVDYREAFARHHRVDWHGVAVTMISREDLIASKRAAGRPQDLVDADNLERRCADNSGAEF